MMNTCSGCANTWSGTQKCHCSGCHVTFGGVSGFDKHRQDFRCIDPAYVDLVLNAEGCWVHPVPEAFKAA